MSNVAGLNDPTKLHITVQKARKHEISLLVETKLGYRSLPGIRSKWGNRNGVFMSCAQNGAPRRGVITLFSGNMEVDHLEDVPDLLGQFNINVFRYKEESYMLVNFYGDPDLDLNAMHTIERLNNKMDEVMTRFQLDHIIIGGDFNFVLNDKDTTSTSRKPRAEALWETVMQDKDLFDLAEVLGADDDHTYFRHMREACSARYDRFYVTRSLLMDAKVTVEKDRTGDHAPVKMEFQRTKRGESFWRFDDSILSSVEGVGKVHEAIAEVLRPLAEDDDLEIGLANLQYNIDFTEHCPVEVLTGVISRVRGKMMEETKKRRERFLKEEKDQIDGLINARNELAANNSIENSERYEQEREKLRLLQSKRTKAAAENNYIQYAVAGERMTSYFFKINGRGKPSREIRKLRVDNREIEGSDVAKHLYQKFAEMAKRDESVGTCSIEEFLGDELARNVKKVPESMYDMLEEGFHEEDVVKVVKGMKSVSAPGPLGITNLLLKEMVPLIKNIIVEAGNKMFFSEDEVQIPPWLFHRKVIFILKPGRSEKDEDSYRGLSMLECIFKIYSKIIGDRMAVVLKDIQDPNQYGFTSGKSCMEPTRTIIDALRHAQETGNPLIVLSTDIYKVEKRAN